jgi:hypothetical protein
MEHTVTNATLQNTALVLATDIAQPGDFVATFAYPKTTITPSDPVPRVDTSPSEVGGAIENTYQTEGTVHATRTMLQNKHADCQWCKWRTCLKRTRCSDGLTALALMERTFHMSHRSVMFFDLRSPM